MSSDFGDGPSNKNIVVEYFVKDIILILLLQKKINQPFKYLQQFLEMFGYT